MSQNILFATPSVSGFSKQKYIYKNEQENLIFPQRQKIIYRCRTAINQQLTESNMRGRGRYVDWWLQDVDWEGEVWGTDMWRKTSELRVIRIGQKVDISWGSCKLPRPVHTEHTKYTHNVVRKF